MEIIALKLRQFIILSQILVYVKSGILVSLSSVTSNENTENRKKWGGMKCATIKWRKLKKWSKIHKYFSYDFPSTSPSHLG